MPYRNLTGWAIAAALSVSVVAFGQGQSGGSGSGSSSGGRTGGSTGSTGSTGGTTSVPSTPSTIPGRTTQPGQQFPEMMNRPIYVSGKVVTDQGTPPPDSVTMELVCGSTIRPQGYTNSKGHFSFQLGQNQGVFQDASMGGAPEMRGMGSSTSMGQMGQNSPFGGSAMNSMGGISERALMGCELRATLAGYRSDNLNLAGRRVMDNPDVGTIILHRLANVEGTIVSASSLAAPKDARKAYDKAREAMRKDKWDEAGKNLQKAVEIYPKYADAWFELGRYYHHSNNGDEAVKAYSQAIQIDPKFVKPYVPMAVLAYGKQNWADMAQFSGKAVRLDPATSPEAFLFNAVAEYNLRHLDVAEKSARQGIQIDSNHRVPKLNHLLGAILADKQDYPGAASQMKSYLEFAPKATDAEQVRKQLAEIEKFASAVAPKQQP